MSRPISRVRKYRKTAQLSQRELAKLLGIRSQGAMSEIESGPACPALRTAIACEILFGVSTRELFPTLYREAESQLLAGASELRKTLHSNRIIPRQHLAALINRLNSTNPPS